MRTTRMLLGLLVLILMAPMIAGASFLEEEAGISAHAALGTLTAQNLIDAASAYKTIERQTSEYIIGSVALPDYSEAHDVHVYLDISGEIIAYYRNDVIMSQMLDMVHIVTGQPVGSKLETALNLVCQAMAVTLTEVKTYDFRYPEAQAIKIIVDEITPGGTDTYRFLIPNNYTLHNAFYALAGGSGYYCYGTASIAIDETTIGSTVVARTREYIYGSISTDLFTPDIYHEVSITNPESDCGTVYGAIVIFYTEN